jgi:hypothetical protein
MAARAAGIVSSLLGLWLLIVTVLDLFDSTAHRTADSYWLAGGFGALALAGGILFLVELERPRSRARLLFAFALMIAGNLLPHSLTYAVLPIVLLGLFAFVPGKVDRRFVILLGLGLAVAGMLYTFSGGLLLLPVVVVLLVIGLVTGKRQPNLR